MTNWPTKNRGFSTKIPQSPQKSKTIFRTSQTKSREISKMIKSNLNDRY